MVVLLVAVAGAAFGETAPETAPMRSQLAAEVRTLFPRGVYWHWDAGHDDAVLAREMDDLVAHHVNLIWFANGPNTVEDVNRVTRLATPRGLKVVVAPGGLDMIPEYVGNEAWLQSVLDGNPTFWQALDPKPFALILDDEPPPGAYMQFFNRYVDGMLRRSVPAFTTVQWGAVDSMAADAPSSAVLCCDFYPFFGSPHGPNGDASYTMYEDVVCNTVRRARETGMTPLIMAQAYQEIWGPARLEADGTLTAIKGAGQHWLPPTEAQMRWQTWAAVALGAKGVIYFPYALGTNPNPETPPIGVAWAVTKDVPTGAPVGLKTSPDFRPSRQYEAMGRSFAEVELVVPVLRDLRPRAVGLGLFTQEFKRQGDIVQLHEHPETGELILAVVASPAREPGHPPRVFASEKVKAVRPLGGAPEGFALEPGQGGLYAVDRNP